MAHSTLLFILLLFTSLTTQELAPQGCTYAKGKYTCDFQEWTPPLQDKSFDPGPLFFLTVTNINGTIPAGVSVPIFYHIFSLFMLWRLIYLLFYDEVKEEPFIIQ